MARQSISIIKLYGPVADEFERQRGELENQHGAPLSGPLFVAYMLDIRRKVLKKQQSDQVDEHAQEIIGHENPEPKGEVS